MSAIDTFPHPLNHPEGEQSPSPSPASPSPEKPTPPPEKPKRGWNEKDILMFFGLFFAFVGMAMVVLFAAKPIIDSVSPARVSSERTASSAIAPLVTPGPVIPDALLEALMSVPPAAPVTVEMHFHAPVGVIMGEGETPTLSALLSALTSVTTTAAPPPAAPKEPVAIMTDPVVDAFVPESPADGPDAGAMAHENKGGAPRMGH
jgi:hypothetical protein